MAKERDEGPRFLAWWMASLSLLLPIAGALLCLLGIMHLYRGGPHAWMLYAGIAAFVLDIVIDFWFAYPVAGRGDEPLLNARGRQLAGRAAIVVEPIENGRGKVRIGDTVWAAEGPDCGPGTSVVVSGVRGTSLLVGGSEAEQP